MIFNSFLIIAMIIAPLSSSTPRLLQCSHPRFKQVFQWLESFSPDTPDGIIDLGEPEFYANVHRYATKPVADCAWESHRRTIDVQMCLEGGEKIEWTLPDSPVHQGDYVQDKDRDEWTFPGTALGEVTLRPGLFALFLSGEPHRPMVHDGTHLLIRKVVVKLPIALLE